MGASEQPYLFSDLPLMEKPKLLLGGQEIHSSLHRTTKVEREAVKKARAGMQLELDIFMRMLVKPIIKSAKKRAGKIKKRLLDTWEDTKAFVSSVTIIQRPSLEAVPVTMDWSNEELLEAHKWVFEESIEALKYEDNQQEKMDVLEWVYSPAYIDKLGKSMDGRPCIIRRHASDIPFSFENCCRAIGLTDPDIFREELVENMNDELKPLLRKYLVGYTGKPL